MAVDRDADRQEVDGSTNLQMLFRPIERIQSSEFITSTSVLPSDDRELVRRIITAYKKAQTLSEDRNTFWSSDYGLIKKPVHSALLRGDIEEVASLLRNPAGNDLFYGFDSACASYYNSLKKNDKAFHARLLYDGLVRLAEAVGAVRAYYPEASLSQCPPPLRVNDLIDAIENEIDCELCFPQIYQSEQGVASARGLITYRSLQAIFQALSLRNILNDLGSRSVVEIGAGLGRTAFYASVLGNLDYTIVDLPITSVAQAYFLGRTIGPEHISLYGEDKEASIKIMPPDAFFSASRTFDIALNADSMVEMSRETAEKYLDTISTQTPVLLSINHEFNNFSVRDIYRSRPKWNVSREPYWMRQGYVRELIRFPATP